MKLLVLLIAVLVAAVPGQAQELSGAQETSHGISFADSVARAMSGLEFQPPTRRGGESALWWTGWALAAGGGVLTVLSNNVLASTLTGPGYYNCKELRTSCTELNKGVLWAGIATAGAGVTMAVIGKTRQRSSIVFVPTQGGAAVLRRITF